jgi:hypothetical protein
MLGKVLTVIRNLQAALSAKAVKESKILVYGMQSNKGSFIQGGRANIGLVRA